MTTPLPPLLDKDRLAIWAQERPLLDPEFADLVIDAVSTLVRGVGDAAWTAETIPPRARDIAYIVARDYYLNPNLLRSETTGPITETRAEAVLQGIQLTDAQRAEIEALVTAAPDQLEGIWSLSFTRGPVETSRRVYPNNVVVYDERGGWPIEYLTEDEGVVFEPPVA
jgi:hypothetical protein